MNRRLLVFLTVLAVVLCVILIVVLYFVLRPQTEQTRVVTLAQGPVRGRRGTDGDYFAFYGIPYATAPTGRDKYKAPLPAPTWTTTFEAVDDERIVCPQLQRSWGSENQVDQCLIANVYVADTTETKLPVIVYVHGGGYVGGNGNIFTPKEMVTRGNLVAVNFNYRLGVHGFLCLGTENAPGNAGMKDMVALLRWVRDNIAQFGGNPDDVTLSGYSAGSGGAELLTFSNTTRGLFQKVILESGATFSGWGVQVDPLESARNYLSHINGTTSDVYDLEELYLTMPLGELIEIGDAAGDSPDTSLPFSPCIERYTGSEIFLDDAPTNILRRGDHIRLPILTGFTEMEGRLKLISFVEWHRMMNEDFSQFLPADLQFANDEEKAIVAERVKEFYFGSANVSLQSVQAFVDFETDTVFGYPHLRSLRLQVEAGNDAIFPYMYSFFDESLRNIDGPPAQYDVDGAGHTAQTYALLELPEQSFETDEYKEMKLLMKQLWINFIRTGRPIPEASALIEGGWPAAAAGRAPYMSLDSPSRLQLGALWADRARLWDEIYDQHYRTPVPPPPPPARTNRRTLNKEDT